MSNMLLPEGSTGVVHGRGAIVPLNAVPEDRIDHGSPREGFLELGTIGNTTVGIWELRDGAVFDTEADEVFVVISGGAKIHLINEGRSVEVKTGDVMRLTAGTKTHWVVKDHIRKVYLTP